METVKPHMIKRMGSYKLENGEVISLGFFVEKKDRLLNYRFFEWDKDVLKSFEGVEEIKIDSFDYRNFVKKVNPRQWIKQRKK